MDPENLFKFCMRCGSPFTWQQNYFECNRCKFQYYLNPIACVAGILCFQKKEILVIKRKIEPFKGEFGLPGGFVVNNETFEAALTREIAEELGLFINEQDLKYLGSYTDRYLYRQWNYHTLGLAFVTHYDVKTKLNPKDDVQDYQYVTIKDLFKIKFPSTSTRAIIAKFLALYEAHKI